MIVSCSERVEEPPAPWSADKIAQVIFGTHKRLTRNVRRYCHDTVSAEDAVQEAICRLFERYQTASLRFSSMPAVLRWLMVTAVFITREQRRDPWLRYRAEQLSDDSPMGQVHQQFDLYGHSLMVATPESEMSARDISKVLAALSVQDRALLRKQMEGFDAEVASGIERRRLHLVRQRARRLLCNAGLIPPQLLRPKIRRSLD